MGKARPLDEKECVELIMATIDEIVGVECQPHQSFGPDIGMDSLDGVEVSMAIEEKLDVTFPAELEDKLRDETTVAEAGKLLNEFLEREAMGHQSE